MAESNSPMGLTKLATAAGYDKATARRLLLELAANGFVEQDTVSRNYALGAALQYFGRVRENSFPLFRTVQPFVRTLAKQTEEMIHATEFGNGVLYSICIEESSRANRVSLDHGQKLPLHATASGIAFLAASTDAFVEAVLKKSLQAFTSKTLTSRSDVLRSVSEAKIRGYSISHQTFDEGVHSVAAAFRGATGKAFGTIAIAMPTARSSPEATEDNGGLVRDAARDISAILSGRKLNTALRHAS